jgi:hypothetical protein
VAAAGTTGSADNCTLVIAASIKSPSGEKAGLIAYTTQGAPVVFAPAALPKPADAHATWLDPRNGSQSSAMGERGADGCTVYKPPVPTEGQGNDWVLMVTWATVV